MRYEKAKEIVEYYRTHKFGLWGYTAYAEALKVLEKHDE